MKLNLNIEGQRTLLEQALKFYESNGFMKILFANRRFFNLARYYVIYRFNIPYVIYNKVCLGFKDYSTNITKCTMMVEHEKVQQLFLFLNPKIVIADTHIYGDKTLVKLLDESRCKIVVGSEEVPVFDFIKHFWPRIVQTILAPKDVDQFIRLPVNTFDELNISSNIYLLDRIKLQGILKHNAKRLVLYCDFCEPFDQTDFLSRVENFVPGNIKNCKIYIIHDCHSIESKRSFLQILIVLFQPTLLCIEADIGSMLYTYKTKRELLPNLISHLESLIKTFEDFNTYNTTLTITVSCRYVYCKEDPKIDLIDLSKELPFKDTHIKIEEDSDIHLEIKSRIGKVKIEFDAILALQPFDIPMMPFYSL